MLDPQSRLRRSAEFAAVLRQGRRAGRPLLSVHLLAPSDAEATATATAPAPVRAGLVVSKAVGGSVVRHRTARRLRHLLRPRLAMLPAGSLLVVRAQPGAAAASSRALGDDLDTALHRLRRPSAARR